MTLSASIVITSYNYARYLPAAIESALGQTRATEVVVVDDGSSDNSSQVIKRCGSDIKAILFERNRGQAAAMNAGVQASNGDIVMFLDSDDWAAPQRAERVLELFQADPELDMVRHDVAHVDSEGSVLLDSVYDFDTGSDLRREIVQFGEAIGTNIGLAFRRTFLERIGPIPESYRTNPDMYLKVAGGMVGCVGHIDQSLAFHRIHSSQATRRWTLDRTAAKAFLDLKWRQASDAADLASRFGGPKEVALGRTWWQAKAHYEHMKAEGMTWLPAWFRHVRLVIAGPLPFTRSLLELGRSLFLAVVPKPAFLNSWWWLHTGRPQLHPLERFRTGRLIERFK